jgi:hypothetical protein
MSLGTILVIILIIFLLGGFSGRFRGYGYGHGHSGMGLDRRDFNRAPDPAAARQDLSPLNH